MTRLFKVTAEIEYIVSAEDEDAAFLKARDEFLNAARDEMNPDVFVTGEITESRQIPRSWTGCIPYGGDGNATVDQLVAAQGKRDE